MIIIPQVVVIFLLKISSVLCDVIMTWFMSTCELEYQV